MAALLDGAEDDGTSAMRHWLDYAHDSLVAFRDHHPACADANGLSEADQLSIVNVSVQMQRLIDNPILAAAKASGTVKVFGMFFDVSTAHVYEVNLDGIVHPAEAVST
jgi:carbonic anhydrase